MHQDPARSAAALTSRQISPHQGFMNRNIEIRIIPNEGCVLAAHLEGQEFPVLLQSVLFDSGPDFIGAREEHPVYPLMNRKSAAHFLFTLQEVEYPSRKTRFLKTLRHDLSNEGRFF